MRQRTWIAATLLSVSAAIGVTGCFTGGIYQVPPGESLPADLTAETPPRVARAQQPALPAALPPQAVPSPVPPPLPSDNGGITQTSLTPAKIVRVSVRALVNGKPIFEDEIHQLISPALMRALAGVPEPQRSERLTEEYNKALEGIIDQEVAYQDACRKLQAGNKQALVKLKQKANEEFEKQLKRIRDSKKVTEEQIAEVKHLLKRQTERAFIAKEYMFSRIIPILNLQAGALAIQDYYNTHLNEFQRVDSVKWQDVFIAVGPKCPTVAQAKRFAEDLIAQCRTNDDFAKLSKYDDGDSKFRDGAGLGSRRGEIKPPELEDTLFKLEEGRIGPVIAMTTGVHIVRVTKREFAGQIPLDVKTQKLIENKIKNQVFEHEYKRIVRELRSRSTIEIEHPQP